MRFGGTEADIRRGTRRDIQILVSYDPGTQTGCHIIHGTGNNPCLRRQAQFRGSRDADAADDVGTFVNWREFFTVQTASGDESVTPLTFQGIAKLTQPALGAVHGIQTRQAVYQIGIGIQELVRASVNFGLVFFDPPYLW